MTRWVVLVVATGCAAKPIDEIRIACATDAECPDDTWCDIPNDICRDLALSGPPQIVLDGIVVGGGAPSTQVVIPANRWTSGSLRLRNDGRAQARTEIVLAGPSCVHAGTSFNKDVGAIDEGGDFAGNVFFDPDPGCASPARVTVDVSASERPFSFDLAVTIAP
jgi:hypothetical protein